MPAGIKREYFICRRMKMRKKSIVGGIAAVLALAMVLCACEQEEEAVECGWLTVKNLPTVPSENRYGNQVYWWGGVYFEEEITSQMHLYNWTFQDANSVASIENPDRSTYTGTSPFPLMEGYRKGFLRTGTYLVQIGPAASEHRQYRVLMNVTFNNGKATIDFNDMMQYDSLPYN
jgi:hypothetical protein